MNDEEADFSAAFCLEFRGENRAHSDSRKLQIIDPGSFYLTAHYLYMISHLPWSASGGKFHVQLEPSCTNADRDLILTAR